MSEPSRRDVAFPVRAGGVQPPPWLTQVRAPVIAVNFRVLAGAAPVSTGDEATDDHAPDTTDASESPSETTPQDATPEDPADPIATDALEEERARLAAETEAMEALAREHEAAKLALAEALAELATLRHRTLMNSERELLELATVLAKTIIEDELDHRPDLHLGMARAALSGLSPTAKATLRLGEVAAQLVEDSLGAVFTRDGVEVRVVRDVTLGAHDCVVESAVGVVDARIDERLDNARDAMLEAHDEASATESVEVDT